MKKILWMFSQATDEAGKSKLTVADLKKVFDNYEIDPIPAPDFEGLDLEAEAFASASIYEEGSKGFFHVELASFEMMGYATFWEYTEELPSEPVQVLLGILPELGYTPITPQFGAFGYKFEGNELECRAGGYHIFRMHGNEMPLNLQETVGAAIAAEEAGLFIPAAFTVITSRYATFLLLFFIEEHGYSRHLSPAMEAYQLEKVASNTYKLGNQVELTQVKQMLDTLSGICEDPESTLSVCGLIVE